MRERSEGIREGLLTTRSGHKRPIAVIRHSFHTERMKTIVFATLFALAGCSAVENTFTVEDERGAVTAADLVLCGSSTPLRRSDGRFSISKPIDCEGSGHIRLTYVSGREQDCPVGYVTAGAKQDFRFRASEAECQKLVS